MMNGRNRSPMVNGYGSLPDCFRIRKGFVTKYRTIIFAGCTKSIDGKKKKENLNVLQEYLAMNSNFTPQVALSFLYHAKLFYFHVKRRKGNEFCFSLFGAMNIVFGLDLGGEQSQTPL